MNTKESFKILGKYSNEKRISAHMLKINEDILPHNYLSD
jgi:hypothetical protein